MCVEANGSLLVLMLLRVGTFYNGIPGFDSWLCSEIQLPTTVHLGRQHRVAQIFGSLPIR